MRAPRSSLVLALTLASAFGLGACGRLKPADTSGAAGAAGSGAAGSSAAGSTQTAGAGGSANVLVTVSGTAAPLPLDMALVGMAEDFTMLKVSIVDPSAVILNPDATPLGSMTLDTSAANCDATSGCKWSISGVNISNPNLLGFVGSVEDLRTGDARVWVKTGTGMGSMAVVAAVRANPMPVTDRRAFVVSRMLEAKLGAFAGPALGTTFAPGALEARGFLIGFVLDKASSAAVPAGVAGAKVTTPATTTAVPFDVIYPNDTFTAAGTATASSGIFIVVPKMAMTVVATWSVIGPDGTRTWTPQVAGTNPNNAYVALMPADG
ncbi:MAG TPA: hypothetical protein VHL80_01530 [Polyangia bacterium]|nr:hypothetical protein [Polyangia bacterium]